MMYPIYLSKKATEDILLLKKENPKYAAKLWDIILDIFSNPYSGIAHPEALKDNLQGWWSRKITDKHRLIYRIKNNSLEIASCYGHYGDR